MRRPIAYLTSFYARAGDTFIRREVEELRRCGWTIHTFSIRRADETENVSEDVLREQRTTDYILERGFFRLLVAFARMWLRAPRRMVRAIRQASSIRWPGLKSWIWHWIYLLEASYLAEQLIDREVGLLHNHIAMNSATVATLASTLSGVPFSMTVHGGGLEPYSAEQWALGRKVAASAKTVCISSFGKSHCMMFTPPEHWHKLHEIRCGLEREFFELSSSDAPDPFRFVCVGRLSPKKGQLVLVEAAAVLHGEGVRAEIEFVGDGPSRGNLERRAHELGLQGSLRFVGWKSSEDVRRSMVQSLAVVLPSFCEGTPVVLMEAMALRRPVIATYVGGIPELVRPGATGFLVPAGSVVELATAIRQTLAMTAQERAEMGERGRQRVLERHNLSVEVRKLSSLFEAAIRDAELARSPGVD